MYLSPEAHKTRFGAQQRDRAYWPTLSVSDTQAVISEPRYHSRRFVKRAHRHLQYSPTHRCWQAPLAEIALVHDLFAPRLHLTKGAWYELRKRGHPVRGRLLLEPSEQLALAQGTTSRAEIVERAYRARQT